MIIIIVIPYVRVYAVETCARGGEGGDFSTCNSRRKRVRIYMCVGHKRRRHIVRRVHCVINLSAIKTHFLSATRRPENKSGLQIFERGRK